MGLDGKGFRYRIGAIFVVVASGLGCVLPGTYQVTSSDGLPVTTNDLAWIDAAGITTRYVRVACGGIPVYWEIYRGGSVQSRSFFLRGRLRVTESDEDNNGSLETLCVHDGEYGQNMMIFNRGDSAEGIREWHNQDIDFSWGRASEASGALDN